MALRDGQRLPLVAQPRGPALSGQRALDAQKGRALGS